MIGKEEQPQAINPEFPTGNLDGFLTEMQQPLQNMDIDERPLETDAFNTITAEMPEEASLQMKAGPAKATAKMLTAVIDNTIPAALGIVAKEDSNSFKATPEEREELVEALTEYTKLHGGDLPPGVMVLIIILTIYGSKLPFAIQQRKINTLREQLEKQQTELAKRENELAEREEKLRAQKTEMLRNNVETEDDTPEPSNH